MVINHNIAALNTYNKLQANTNSTTSSLEKLSSGSRINKAADDAAGLAISQKMQAQINGLDTASDNSQNAISLVQTAEGALKEEQAILQRMNELAVQAANGTNGTSDCAKLQDEVSQLSSALDNISSQTTFNGKAIMLTGAGDGLFSASGLTMQVGSAAGDTMTIKLTTASGCGSMTGVSAADLGLSNLTIPIGTSSTSGTSSASALSGISLSSTLSANAAITTITAAIETVSNLRSMLGAYQNRLTHTINNLSTESENLTSASSQITDVDMAKEMTNYTKNNILVQASEAMLAQANQLPQGVLSLLK